MTMDFLKFFWQVGIVGKLVFLILFFMSVLSWYYIILNFIIFRGFRESLLFWKTQLNTLRDLTAFIREVKANPDEGLTRSFKSYLSKFAEVYNFYSERKEDRAKEASFGWEVEEIARIEMDEAIGNLGRGLGFLATTASTAPFIGLFGTVWGIMRAFHEIGLKGSATLATVAPGIAEALINTAMGLFVAIPSAIAYNYFVLKRDKFHRELELLFRRIVILSKREAL